MAKKLPKFGVNNYHKRTPKKRPGRHAKVIVNAYLIVNPTKAKVVSVVGNYIFLVDCILHAYAGI